MITAARFVAKVVVLVLGATVAVVVLEQPLVVAGEKLVEPRVMAVPVLLVNVTVLPVL